MLTLIFWTVNQLAQIEDKTILYRTYLDIFVWQLLLFLLFVQYTNYHAKKFSDFVAFILLLIWLTDTGDRTLCHTSQG